MTWQTERDVAAKNEVCPDEQDDPIAKYGIEMFCTGADWSRAYHAQRISELELRLAKAEVRDVRLVEAIDALTKATEGFLKSIEGTADTSFRCNPVAFRYFVEKWDKCKSLLAAYAAGENKEQA